MIKCQISGKNTNPDQITFLEFGFGKLGSLTPLKYEVRIPVDKFCGEFERIYKEGVDELIRDNELTGEFEPPYPDAKTYPSLQKFIDIPGKYFFDYISTFHEVDVLKIFLEEDKSDSQFVIRTLDNVERDGDWILLEGIATKN